MLENGFRPRSDIDLTGKENILNILNNRVWWDGWVSKFHLKWIWTGSV
jgi:hypothetical protein